MNNLYRIIIFLLAVSFAACASTPSNMAVANNDEDKDIGLGGTGMLAATDSEAGSGLGGTGILGKITGFGSIFVNGIEIEYDNETAFTIDGKTAVSQQLEIGDVVEVLTTDANKYTQARVINLRHEVIGKVESVLPLMVKAWYRRYMKLIYPRLVQQWLSPVSVLMSKPFFPQG